MSQTELKKFKGLNNVADPMRGVISDGYGNREFWEWQTVADNVNITNEGSIVAREGYTQLLATAITGSYSTFDHKRLYLTTPSGIVRAMEDGTTKLISPVVINEPYWAELNDRVYISSSSGKYIIKEDDEVIVWGIPTPAPVNVSTASGRLFAGDIGVCITYVDADGREGGTSPASFFSVAKDTGVSITEIPQLAGYKVRVYATEPDGTVFYLVSETDQTSVTLSTPAFGMELTTQFLDPPPEEATRVTAMGANLYLMMYNSSEDVTVIWISNEFTYHLFNLNVNYFIVPGEVTQLFGADTGLLIATQTRIYQYDNDALKQVAEYGAVAGQHADLGPDGKIYFWTKRGLCRIMPFENLTEDRISIAPGLMAGGGVIEHDGYRTYITVINQGGDAYNRRIA